MPKFCAGRSSFCSMPQFCAGRSSFCASAPILVAKLIKHVPGVCTVLAAHTWSNVLERARLHRAQCTYVPMQPTQLSYA
eukprot:11546589-Alexandrium_andersonii.AAC.1